MRYSIALQFGIRGYSARANNERKAMDVNAQAFGEFIAKYVTDILHDSKVPFEYNAERYVSIQELYDIYLEWDGK